LWWILGLKRIILGEFLEGCLEQKCGAHGGVWGLILQSVSKKTTLPQILPKHRLLQFKPRPINTKNPYFSVLWYNGITKDGSPTAKPFTDSPKPNGKRLECWSLKIE
jgi:hypothetical protein